MLWFTKPARPARPAPALRARLRLEQLDYRAVPSAAFGDEPFSSRDDDDGGLMANAVAPVIVEFMAVQVQPGVFLLSGRVVLSPSPGGLTVAFGGVPSAAGMSATTAADGTFMRMISVRTDGSDVGTVTAMTFANGLVSNTATCEIAPTA
jgi:hypothetical protein